MWAASSHIHYIAYAMVGSVFCVADHENCVYTMVSGVELFREATGVLTSLRPSCRGANSMPVMAVRLSVRLARHAHCAREMSTESK